MFQERGKVPRSYLRKQGSEWTGELGRDCLATWRALLWRLRWNLKRGQSAVLCLFPASFSLTGAGEDRRRVDCSQSCILSEWAQETKGMGHAQWGWHEWSQNFGKTEVAWRCEEPKAFPKLGCWSPDTSVDFGYDGMSTRKTEDGKWRGTI